MLIKLKIIFSLILLILIPANLMAKEYLKSDPCSIPSDLSITRPDDNLKPTKIKVGFYVIDLMNIKDSDQTFFVDILYNVNWNDPRLSEKKLGKSLKNCSINMNKIWFPKVLDINIISGDNQLPENVTIDNDGNILFIQRFLGTYVNNLKYNEFPFDTQILKILYATYDYGPTDVEFVFNEDKFGINDNLSIVGWKNIRLLEPVIKTVYFKDENRHISSIEFRLSVERDKRYYIWKIILPLCFIVFMAWAVFWIPIDAYARQIALSSATIFTLITYRFSIDYQLPKLPYFTKLDNFIFAATILVFLALGIAITTSNLVSKNKGTTSKTILRYSRLFYIIAFIIILLYTLVI